MNTGNLLSISVSLSLNAAIFTIVKLIFVIATVMTCSHGQATDKETIGELYRVTFRVESLEEIPKNQ